MIKALIIDDEPLACELVSEYLQDIDGIEEIGRCHDGFQGLKAIQELKPDLIFLDVQMPKINGFEMLELVDDPPAVIFTTAFDEYALKAFENNAIDYLLKPFSQDRFDAAVEKFKERHQKDKNKLEPLLQSVGQNKDSKRVVIKDGAKIRIIPYKEIIHFEADDDYVKIYTAQGNFMKKKSLQFYEDSLDPTLFVRVHRSHLINISQMDRIDPYQKNSHLARLKDGSKIPVSRTGYQRLREALNI